jgi:DHA1 family tetracycline resistance protein-like MFS transporter
MGRSQTSGRSPLAFIFLTVFIDLLGFGIVIPLLPVYSKAYGASPTELGVLFGCFSAMQFVFAPMWGRISDRIGRRPVLIGGLLGTAASYVLFGFSHSMALLFASRLLAGFFGANISTAQAYIADVTTPENRAKGMGLVGAAFGLGFTFGPLIGGELTHISMAAPGFAAAAFSLLAAIFGYLKLPEPPRVERKASRIFSLTQLRQAWAIPRIGILLILSFLFIASFSSFETMFIPFGIVRFPAAFDMPEGILRPTLEDTLRAAPWAGRYLCGIGLIAAGVQGGLIRRLVPRFGEPNLAVVGPLLLAIAFVIVGFATTWGFVILGCLVMPLGFGLNNPSLYGLISRASPPDEQGAYLGMNQSVASLARVVGPSLAGLAFQLLSPRAPFLIAACALLVSSSLAAVYRRKYGATFSRGAPAGSAEV